MNFSSGTECAVEASQLYDLSGCITNPSALEDLVLQVIEGSKTDNGNAPVVFTHTYEAFLFTLGLTMDGALDRICTIVSETNTSDNRATMTLAVTGSSSRPLPCAGGKPEFCATCFGVSHGAGVCPTKPEFAGRCCCFCRNGRHCVSTARTSARATPDYGGESAISDRRIYFRLGSLRRGAAIRLGRRNP